MSFRFSVIVELLIFVTCEKGAAQAVHEPHFSRWFFKGQYRFEPWDIVTPSTENFKRRHGSFEEIPSQGEGKTMTCTSIFAS
jgi:hypothetical protein